jgi:low affinity Fe/Cu permease
MACIKITKVIHEFHDLNLSERGTLSIGQNIDEQIHRNLREGHNVLSVGVELDEKEWMEMQKDYAKENTPFSNDAIAVAEVAYDANPSSYKGKKAKGY